MTSAVKVTVPDLGNVDTVLVIEVAVKAGDAVKKEQTLITLESDKASMEIPCPTAGIIDQINVKVGDKIKQGDLILTVMAEEAAQKVPEKVAAPTTESKAAPAAPQAPAQTTTQTQTVHVPDIGNFDKVDVIEIPISVGMSVKLNQTLVVLESDKASMEIPAPFAGTITSIALKVGDKVAKDAPICEMSTGATENAAPVAIAPTPPVMTQEAVKPAEEKFVTTSDTYASPGVRRLARELNIDLKTVRATGEKGRITKNDLNDFIKNKMQSSAGAGFAIEPMPIVDFSQFGEIEFQDLSRIKKISAKFLHRNWVNIPHVTQFDEVDITDLEDFRQQNKAKAEAKGVKLTPLVFLMKAAVAALKQFPVFNASLAPNGDQLILKHYYHIGVAVDTPNGLVVPVVRDVNLKGFMELAEELKTISAKARAGQLTPREMQGSSFSISSLGGIGGTAFTPIINAPDVAILGVSKSRMMPVYVDGQFVPRLMLPLSLSYDHRVIDGAQGAQFVTYLGEMLGDMRQMLL
jgi:pyruvate dehydrogenase E2 component (dihydrolipoamide acetyltransferase)